MATHNNGQPELPTMTISRVTKVTDFITEGLELSASAESSAKALECIQMLLTMMLSEDKKE